MKPKGLKSPVSPVILALIAAIILCSTFNNLFPIEPGMEYKIKAGFLYRFLLFAEWPKKMAQGTDYTIIIGIIGKDRFGDVFDFVIGETVEGKRLLVRRLEGEASPEQLKKCSLLFISPELGPGVDKILELLREYPVLTVSETEGFADRGGMINFVMKDNKVNFEINKAAADRVGITLSSKLLRVATRIIRKNNDKRIK